MKTTAAGSSLRTNRRVWLLVRCRATLAIFVLSSFIVHPLPLRLDRRGACEFLFTYSGVTRKNVALSLCKLPCPPLLGVQFASDCLEEGFICSQKFEYRL